MEEKGGAEKRDEHSKRLQKLKKTAIYCFCQPLYLSFHICTWFSRDRWHHKRFIIFTEEKGRAQRKKEQRKAKEERWKDNHSLLLSVSLLLPFVYLYLIYKRQFYSTEDLHHRKMCSEGRGWWTTVLMWSWIPRCGRECLDVAALMWVSLPCCGRGCDVTGRATQFMAVIVLLIGTSFWEAVTCSWLLVSFLFFFSNFLSFFYRFLFFFFPTNNILLLGLAEACSWSWFLRYSSSFHIFLCIFSLLFINSFTPQLTYLYICLYIFLFSWLSLVFIPLSHLIILSISSFFSFIPHSSLSSFLYAF